MSDLTVSRVAPRGMVTIRADLGGPGAQAALLAATGCVMPGQRRIALQGRRALAWMAPDEAMLFLPPEEVAEVPGRIAAALGAAPHLAVDVSDARVIFRIAGPGARMVLAKGAPVDLAPQAFRPGDFRRTRLGQVAVAFWMTGDGAFELMCFRSVAGFVEDWLLNAARSVDPGLFAEG
ncbi:sarcosine oxidase subunit gamma [Amaricoccus solimangrovi]|uniref:Sarcosine oxidase subunit gamma n=1 Tax=Amaricoccus solimangrovi TaxID=2589815 RepID=A0A501X024_9RHOB|nr:sarcosine oxidase subunit gamma family protein [Amaricoccus solimangrovi]TPE53527.1 sarcosine oxidase subunit gamma [Amaricoccus solimangrovi]